MIRQEIIKRIEIGKILSEAGKQYGKNIIKQYADKLSVEVGKKYNERTLYSIKKFYEVFSNEIFSPMGRNSENGKLSPLGTKLSWTHYKTMLSLKDVNEIRYYIDVCEQHNLTKRELEARIKSDEYNRLPEETKNKLIKSNNILLPDLVPNPIIINSNELDEHLNEFKLKQLIVCNLDKFLEQLGNDFCYRGSEYRIKVDNRYNYIDLLLYNIKYKSYVVVELKVTELKKEHVGQIQIYMNYIDNNLKTIEQNKTIGIIICKRNNEYVIDYCSDPRIISREYKIVLSNWRNKIKESSI